MSAKGASSVCGEMYDQGLWLGEGVAELCKKTSVLETIQCSWTWEHDLGYVTNDIKILCSVL